MAGLTPAIRNGDVRAKNLQRGLGLYRSRARINLAAGLIALPHPIESHLTDRVESIVSLPLALASCVRSLDVKHVFSSSGRLP